MATCLTNTKWPFFVRQSLHNIMLMLAVVLVYLLEGNCKFCTLEEDLATEDRMNNVWIEPHPPS